MEFQFKTLTIAVLVMCLFLISSCDDDGHGDNNDESNESSITIDIASISGVIPPVLGEIPVTSITETEQYTGTVVWNGNWSWSSRFAGTTV